ncbi:hypothetical protein TTHERM_00268010 (macronuclear) [Tetrahymena thermophila SB210]|uniref:Kinesin motor catalytic domain protein n=1 Tax=Tetrahymena thermophila (strain SB210) TaxID=312017 RepID=I7MIZ3_TETTS|nr:hypothetical protein TTHERM_00268010 [Tetrahymena thermophila SB210]EAR95691.2 hypothetical protein TTHERM_00268010 [Tetrahymena thermophila SB210]|eukprot:XP_001015936.2 hypothetical protein TTHERM_00268010 [Tetrahymena thermophila SB210]
MQQENQQLQQTTQQTLEKQKLVIAARIRIHNTINYKIDDNPDAGKSQQNLKQQKENVSQTGTFKSKSNIPSSSQISSTSSITMKTTKTGLSKMKVGASQQQKKKKDESKVNIYACKMTEKNPITNIVSLNQTPLSYSLLSKYLKNDNNILTQKQTLLPKSRQYQFDVAFSQETSQDDLYSFLLKKKIKQTLNGFQTSVFVVGPEFSGRKYTVRGDENIMNKNSQFERGLMVRACEDILSLIDISKDSIRSRKAIVGGVYYNLGVQIYCVKDDAEVDLLVNAPEQLLNKNSSQDIEMGCFDITSTNELLVYYRQAQNRLNMINDALKGQDFKKSATIFVRLLVLKNKQIYSSVNFAIFFNYNLLTQSKFYPVRDYLREIEKMNKRQLKTYQFQNKLLHHINLCFSSGPEYSAVLLGQFDSAPQQIEHSQLLLQVLSNLRTSKQQRSKESTSQIGNRPILDPSNQNDDYQEQQVEDKEVQDFILSSNRKSELNETAGFNMATQEDQVEQEGAVQQFRFDENEGGKDRNIGGEEDQQNQKPDEQQNQRAKSSQQNFNKDNQDYEQEEEYDNTRKIDNKKFNTFGNDTTYKSKNYELNQFDQGDEQDFYEMSGSKQGYFNQSQRIPQDVEGVIQDIFSYSDATRGMDDNQKLQWVLNQQRNLEYFQDGVNLLKPPVKGSPQDLQIRKINEARAFLQDLRGELDIKEYVKRNIEDSHCDEENEEIHSSSSGIDTRAYLKRERNHERNDSQIERNLHDMKRKIMDQIDKTIQDSPIKGRTNSSQIQDYSNNAALTTHQNENTQERINSQSNIQNTQLTSVNKRYNTSGSDQEEGVVKNLKKLRNQILEKEKLQDESNYKLKNKSYVLNDELDIMRQKLLTMQDAVKSRDRIIADYELQLGDMRSSQYSLHARRQSRETLLEKAQEDMHNNILHLKNKLSLRKAQIVELKDEIKRMEIEFQEERRRVLEERNNYERSFEEYREKFEQEKLKTIETERLLDKARIEIQNRDAMTERLQNNTNYQDKNLTELQYRLNQEQDLTKELRIQNQLQEKKIIEYEKQLSHFEEKLLKQKRKFEDERASLVSEKRKEQEKRKEKSLYLKQELKNLDKKVQELTTEGLDIRTENDRLQRQVQSLQDELDLKNREIVSQKDNIQTLREDLDSVKHSYRDSDLLIKREQQEYKKLEKEIKKLNEQLIDREERISDWQYQLEKEREQYKLLEQEYHHQQETNRQQQDLISKIERQNEFLSNMQNRDIDKLEERVDTVNHEINILRKENDSLRQENQQLRSEMVLTDRDSNLNKEKLYKYKKQVKILKQSLVEADDKLRELIYQKHNEIRQIQSPLQDEEYY